MHKLITYINNAYAAKHECVYIPCKSRYLIVLQLLLKRSLISFYTIIFLKGVKHIYIKLSYFKGRPLFFLTLLEKKSNPRYLKKHHVKSFSRKEMSAYTYLSTSAGWYTTEHLSPMQFGGKLMVTIHIIDKNLDA